MNIGVDIRVLAKGTRTGIEEYTINLLSRLLSLDHKNNYKLFYNAFRKAPLKYFWLRRPNVKVHEFNYPNRFVLDPMAKFFGLPKVNRLLGGADVFFCPHFLLNRVSGKCKKVITFHDLSFEYFPEFFPWRKRSWHKFLAPKKRAYDAQKIIAVSHSTKNDLVDLYNVPGERIKVIYSGVGEEFRKLSGGKWKAPTVKKYKLPKKFILYFGTIEPRKNLAGLIKAYEIFRKKLTDRSQRPALVIAGQKGWLYRDILALAKHSQFSRDIIFTDFVESEDKVYLYNLASAFVYPSFFEGFGFPPLEAMSCGVPVICSNTSSFPEVAGEGALMIDPYNFEEMAWAINEIWTDENLSEFLVAKGFEQAKKFSWNKCAKETLEVLIGVAS
jgi:glycosyltransferase involved in cell wall biosynthesis